jgi:isoquinoline 1-oxidoreductase alpha subunit
LGARDELGLTGSNTAAASPSAAPARCSPTASRSLCSTPVGALGAAKITTIESLGGNHPLQWPGAHDVPQCGYCQSGQMMSAGAAGRQSAPTTSDHPAMDGNICRCGTYQRIHARIKEPRGRACPRAARRRRRLRESR